MDSGGYDAGKKVKGKKRHILVDTLGLLIDAIVHPADIQDRDGGALMLATLFGRWAFLKMLFADGGYAGPRFQIAANSFSRNAQRPNSVASNKAPPSRSWISAGCTIASSRRPNVSTRIWRFLPLIFLPAS